MTQNGSNWRARVKVGRATVNGPTRQAKAAAEEDARLLQQAQQISNAEVHKVAERLQKDAADARGVVTVAKHGVGWRARVKGAQASKRSYQVIQGCCRRRCQSTSGCAADFCQRATVCCSAAAAGGC